VYASCVEVNVFVAMSIPQRYGNEIQGMFYNRTGWPMQSAIAWLTTPDGLVKAFFHFIGEIGTDDDSKYTLNTIKRTLQRVFNKFGFRNEVVLLSDGYVH